MSGEQLNGYLDMKNKKYIFAAPVAAFTAFTSYAPVFGTNPYRTKTLCGRDLDILNSSWCTPVAEFNTTVHIEKSKMCTRCYTIYDRNGAVITELLSEYYALILNV